MNAKRLQKVSFRLLKTMQMLEKAAKTDPGIVPLAKQAHQLFYASHDLQNERALAEAKKKDKGEILWTLICPRDSSWSFNKITTRTPNIVVTTSAFECKEFSCVNDWEDPWKQLAKEWTPADPVKMAERAKMVDSKARGFWYQPIQEAA